MVDAGAGLGPDPENGIGIVELPVQIGTQRFDGETDLSEFYQRLRNDETAVTSTPSPGAYLEAFRALDCERILCLTIPSQFSGMDQAARLAAQMLADEDGEERVTVLETGTAAAGLGICAHLAALRCKAGMSFEEIESAARRAAENVQMFGALATLHHLSKSGRLPSLIAGISDTLHVHPVFRLVNGEASRVALARNTDGAIRALAKEAASLSSGKQLWVVVFHSDEAESAAHLENAIKESAEIKRIETIGLAPIIGSHIGPGAIGFAALPLDAEDLSLLN